MLVPLSYHIQYTQQVIPQHKSFYLILSMGHQFGAHVNRFGGKAKVWTSFRRAGLVRDGQGDAWQEGQWEGAESSRHGEDRRQNGGNLRKRGAKAFRWWKQLCQSTILPGWHIQGLVQQSLRWFAHPWGRWRTERVSRKYQVSFLIFPPFGCSYKNI